MHKVLLVNFDSSTYKKLQDNPKIDAYKGDLRAYPIDHEFELVNVKFSFKFERPIYECRAVFINLDNIEKKQIDSNKGVKFWGDKDAQGLVDYLRKGIDETFLVFFTGETVVDSLSYLGIEDLHLEDSTGNDSEKNAMRPGFMDNRLFELLKKHTSLPQSKNINQDDIQSSKQYIIMHPVIKNKNDETITSLLSYRLAFDEEVNGVIMPHPKSLEKTVIDLMDWLLDKRTSMQWMESEVFYPPKLLNSIHQQIQTTREKAEKKLKELEQEKKEFKSKYYYLKHILTEKDDILTEAVYKIFTEVLNLKVTDSDAVNEQKKKPKKEDFQIKLGSELILVEVKGTKKEIPSPIYFTQIAMNARRQQLNDAKLCLVLNYDLNSKPIRKPAYAGEEEASMEGIHFVDTQVLHKVAVDVIEGKLTVNEARKILFGKAGRIQYDS